MNKMPVPESLENSSQNTPVHHQNNLSSPMKAVNLLPDVPAQQSSRRLTDKEQKDCDVIGMMMHSLFLHCVISIHSTFVIH